MRSAVGARLSIRACFSELRGAGGGIRTTSDTIDRKQKRLVVPIAPVCGCLLCDPVALFVCQRLHLA